VCPRQAATSVMRIAFLVGVRMMDSVRPYPLDGPTFQRQCAKQRQRILERLWKSKAAMREKPVKPYANSKRAGRIPKQQHNAHGAPLKKSREERRERCQVNYG